MTKITPLSLCYISFLGVNFPFFSSSSLRKCNNKQELKKKIAGKPLDLNLHKDFIISSTVFFFIAVGDPPALTDWGGGRGLFLPPSFFSFIQQGQSFRPHGSAQAYLKTSTERLIVKIVKLTKAKWHESTWLFTE